MARGKQKPDGQGGMGLPSGFTSRPPSDRDRLEHLADEGRDNHKGDELEGEDN